jgi:arylsulfatase A-like enzyme
VFYLVALLVGCRSANRSRGASASDPGPHCVYLTDDQRFDTIGCAKSADSHATSIARCHGAIPQSLRRPLYAASAGFHFTGHNGGMASAILNSASVAQWAETYPGLLRAAGYRTGFIGKFGVGDASYIAAKKADFDFWRGLPGQAGEWFIDPKDPSGTHATARFGNGALEFIQSCPDNQPFCLSISFNAPHARDGNHANSTRPSGRKPLCGHPGATPTTGTDQFFQALPWFVRNSERRRWEKALRHPEMFQRTLRDYYRLVTGIDREVGRIAAKLEERGLARNTVIIFTSDDGWFAGERGLADKWLMYD